MKTLRVAWGMFVAVGLAGCSSSSGAGDVDRAVKGAAEAPRSVDQLPPDMPPQAKAAASAAMGQARAAEQTANDPARVRAMQEMRKQQGR